MLKHLALISLILSGCSPNHLVPQSASFISKIANNTVKFVRPDGRALASGGIIRTENGNTVILTNWHVCNEANEGLINFKLFPETIETGIVLNSDPSIDLCAVAFPKELQGLKPGLEFANDVYGYENVMALGYPLDHVLTPSYGFILSRGILEVGMRPQPTGECLPGGKRVVDIFVGMFCLMPYDLVLTNVITYPGNSGSPVVNSDGDLVGVINSGDTATNQGNMVPLDIVKKYLKGH